MLENRTEPNFGNTTTKGRKGGAKKDVECFNCHKKGHYKADCWAEGGGKEGQGPKMKGKARGKAKETTAAVAAKEKVEEKVEAWMVSLGVVDESEKIFDEPDLSCGCIPSDDDWFDEMDSLPDLQPVSDSDESDTEEINSPEKSDDMDSLPDLESVSDSEIDTEDFLESFGEEYIIPSINPSTPNNPDTCSEVFESLDSPSDNFEYVPMKEEAYMTTYKASALRGTPGELPTDIDL